jgi:hypothetical protein
MTKEPIFANSVVMDLQTVRHVTETMTISTMVSHRCAAIIVLNQNLNGLHLMTNARNTHPQKALVGV